MKPDCTPIEPAYISLMRPGTVGVAFDGIVSIREVLKDGSLGPNLLDDPDNSPISIISEEDWCCGKA